MSNAVTSALSNTYHKAVADAEHVGASVKHKVGSYAGHQLKWLNGSSFGSALKTAAWGLLTTGLAAASVAAAVRAISLVVFGVAALTSGAGLAIGLTSIGLAVGLTAASVLAIKATFAGLNHTTDNFHQARALAALGK